MLGYIAFFIDSYDNISRADVLESYLELSFDDFYFWLQENNVEFHYIFYFRPINFSSFSGDNVYIFPVRCVEYGV